MTRVIGRLCDLARRARRDQEQQIVDELVRWSLDANHAWLCEGVQHEQPFLQISPASANTVLAWELAQLHREGYVGIGPLWVPRAWLADGERYRRCMLQIAEHVLGDAAGSAPEYVPKVAGELASLLAMWPHVLLLPTSRSLSLDDLLRLRAWPLHPLGVVPQPTRADGAVRSVAEYFAHDIDHARYKVREDLRARGRVVPDPYVDGSTFDAVRGAHRAVMAEAAPMVDAEGWRAAAQRAARLDEWLSAIGGERDPALAAAARWLLLELLHEKSLPPEPAVLLAALAGDAHVTKLAHKVARGFHGPHGPDAAALAALPSARTWWLRRLETSA